MALTVPQDDVLSQKLVEELADVECRFAAELESDLKCVQTLVRHLERYRGKRLRPMLVLISGMATTPAPHDLTDRHRIVATVCEMVHMATLVHDDILDEAEVRRRGATINHLRGNETAVMLGDYLISHAYHLCSSLGDTTVSRIIAQATNVVCEGELLQLANRDNVELDEQTYYEIIRRKTASLCGVCCMLGGMLGSPGEGAADALYEYGEKLGQAFQVIDDVLDLTGNEDTVGKTLGRDLEKGKLTLPLIRHRQMLGPRDRAAFQELLRRGVEDPQAVRQIGRAVEESGSIKAAGDVAARWVGQARRTIDVLPESAARQRLYDLADAVLTRKS